MTRIDFWTDIDHLDLPLAEEEVRPARVVVGAHLDLDGLAIRRRQPETGGAGEERAFGFGLHSEYGVLHQIGPALHQ